MIDEFDEAFEELKRADHLVYVTLKYTRTADVIKNIIKRLINAYDLVIIEALTYAQKKKKIKSIPLIPRARCELLLKLIKDKKLKEYIDFYFLLKKIDKLDYTKKNEYRKNVTLVSMENDLKLVEVDIKTLYQYHDKTRELVVYLKNWMQGKNKSKNFNN